MPPGLMIRSGTSTLGAPDYPESLTRIAKPPHALHWRGTRWPPPARAVAVVGTRAASPYGLEMAETIAADLARAGVCVVSGLARGIDAAAHRGALAVGGSSVAVLAADPASPYPPDTHPEYDRLLADGAVCAEYPAGTARRRGLFLRRNRIVAGLALGVVVIEAPPRSGALATAACGRAAGRFVAALPGDVTREQARGTLALLRSGAHAIGGAADVLALLAPASSAGEADGGDAARVLRVLTSGAARIEELARALSLPPARVQAVVARLEVAGAIRRNPGGRIVREEGG